MSKKSFKSKKKNLKWLEILFIGLVAALVVLLILQAVLPQSPSYVVTEDGHVHTTDGAHIGTYEEVFGTTTDGEATTGEDVTTDDCVMTDGDATTTEDATPAEEPAT